MTNTCRFLQALQPVDLQVGDPVLVVHRNQPGLVRFKGLTQFGTGEWVGVELDVPAGKHNGTWQGGTYFDCPANHGIFVRATSLERRAPADVSGEAADVSGGVPADHAPGASSGAPEGVSVRVTEGDVRGVKEGQKGSAAGPLTGRAELANGRYMPSGDVASGNALYSPWSSFGKRRSLYKPQLPSISTYCAKRGQSLRGRWPNGLQ